MLTTGIDSGAAFTGTDKGDVFNAVIDGTTAANNTWTGLDSLDGGAGTDILNINDISAKTAAGGIDLTLGTIQNVETMNIQSVNGIGSVTAITTGLASATLDASIIEGLATINTTKSLNVMLTAAATTDVNVSGATGAIVVEGGKNISVTDATVDKDITIGANTKNAGTITVTDTKQGAGEVKIEGGTDVTVTTTGSVKTGGAGTFADITIGTATVADQASGAVIVNATGAAYDDTAAAATVMGDIYVTGGKTISVTQKATSDNSKAAADNNATAGADMTQGDVI